MFCVRFDTGLYKDCGLVESEVIMSTRSQGYWDYLSYSASQGVSTEKNVLSITNINIVSGLRDVVYRASAWRWYLLLPRLLFGTKWLKKVWSARSLLMCPSRLDLLNCGYYKTMHARRHMSRIPISPHSTYHNITHVWFKLHMINTVVLIYLHNFNININQPCVI